MSQTLNELAPDYLQQKIIGVSPANPLESPEARKPTTLVIDASGTLPNGLMLPIEVLVTGPSDRSFERKVFTRSIPSSFTFTPKEGGRFTVVVREVAHNLWWGSTELAVAGQSFDDKP
jgi:hypothetical protein